jgi:hypothetical protein
MHKEELGESGQGNCRRYRELCASGARGYCHPHHWVGSPGSRHARVP